jgi:hypothetical protein
MTLHASVVEFDQAADSSVVRRKPHIPEEQESLHRLARTLQEMVVREAKLLLHVESRIPAIELRYRRGHLPEALWASFLWIRVSHQNDKSWLARVTEFTPAQRILRLAPRRSTEEIGYALDAARTPGNTVKTVSLGLPFWPGETIFKEFGLSIPRFRRIT